MRNKSRGSGTADKSRGSGTADKSRGSGTADKSRGSGAAKTTKPYAFVAAKLTAAERTKSNDGNRPAKRRFVEAPTKQSQHSTTQVLKAAARERPRPEPESDVEYERETVVKSSWLPPAGATVIRMKIERRSTNPWVFQDMVEKPVPKPKSGSVVEVLDATGHWVGRAFYNSHSKIALRILTINPDEAIDEEFFYRKLEQALHLRRELLQLETLSNAYRLVHSEGDELSGLVIDRFDTLLVLEYFSAGMWLKRDLIRKALSRLIPEPKHYWFADARIAELEGFDAGAPPVPEAATILEHGLKFLVAPGEVHKTGFFVDQRDARQQFAQIVRQMPEARVLDLCCNTGGFAIYAKAQGHAKEVVAVDLDETVIELAQRNARLNQAKIRFVHADIFPWLRDAVQNAERFDAVVLDPAKLTRDRDQVIGALKKYLDMNKLALSVVKPGGILLTCSCTGLVSEAQFLEMLRRAAFYAQRTVQIIRVMGAGGDHPFLAQAQEGRYLKAVFCRVY